MGGWGENVCQLTGWRACYFHACLPCRQSQHMQAGRAAKRHGVIVSGAAHLQQACAHLCCWRRADAVQPCWLCGAAQMGPAASTQPSLPWRSPVAAE